MTTTITQPAANGSTALQLRGIRKSFGGVEVLHGVDLDLQRGQVLALLGENGAGKSTLVKIIAGDYKPDGGELRVDGDTYGALDPIKARSLGIRMMFQEIMDAPTLSVAENVSLGQLPKKRGIVNWRELRRRARAALDMLGVSLDLDAPVESLAIGERQVVEIARAVSDRTGVLILDEPTAALSGDETARLFDLLRRLRDGGAALVYITHRLDEVSQIADTVHVLRDGAVSLSAKVTDTSREALVTAMVGHAVGESERAQGDLAAPSRSDGPPPLRFRKASCEGEFEDVELEVAAGEIVALYGKVGSGMESSARAVFGLKKLTGGEISVAGVDRPIRGPHDAIAHGVGLLAADRQREGTFGVRSVAENLAAPSWPTLARGGLFVTARLEAKTYDRWHGKLRIRSRNDPAQPIQTLSGGNQQKVLVGRWFEQGSRVLVLIEPTRGVDIAAREDIYQAIRSLAAQGTAVLIASSDHEEVAQIAHRAVVMARRRIVARFSRGDITTKALIDAAGG